MWSWLELMMVYVTIGFLGCVYWDSKNATQKCSKSTISFEASNENCDVFEGRWTLSHFRLMYLWWAFHSLVVLSLQYFAIEVFWIATGHLKVILKHATCAFSRASEQLQQLSGNSQRKSNPTCRLAFLILFLGGCTGDRNICTVSQMIWINNDHSVMQNVCPKFPCYDLTISESYSNTFWCLCQQNHHYLPQLTVKSCKGLFCWMVSSATACSGCAHFLP